MILQADNIEFAKDSVAAGLMYVLSSTAQTLPTGINDFVQLGIIFYMSFKMYIEFLKWKEINKNKNKDNDKS